MAHPCWKKDALGLGFYSQNVHYFQAAAQRTQDSEGQSRVFSEPDCWPNRDRGLANLPVWTTL